ncbi:hypothetical protein F9L07_11420 [Pimelobacter simplex]|uniref:Uncharacterized protein n=1 Tax=Nocardioides simplex TaxID=2045 RepID=A0A7J5E291_NOCSI|nr:hypothetical protein [Pimelobacter simplex]KAB2812381.1 hypothetical protein F9L07_11420 [Pimelobacter simplex]
MQDIKDVLDAELRTPPAPTFDVAATLGPGRRAVRRRRLAAGGAALALALVMGGAGVAVTSQFAGSQGADPVQVAAGVSERGSPRRRSWSTSRRPATTPRTTT